MKPTLRRVVFIPLWRVVFIPLRRVLFIPLRRVGFIPLRRVLVIRFILFIPLRRGVLGGSRPARCLPPAGRRRALVRETATGGLAAGRCVDVEESRPRK